jgi:hypothetical protein
VGREFAPGQDPFDRTSSRSRDFARWQRRDDVEAFWTSGNAAPLPGATLESIEILDQVEHMTLEHVADPRKADA